MKFNSQWRLILLWVIVALSLYPATSLFNLLLFGRGADVLPPTISVYVSGRQLLYLLLDDWLHSLLSGAVLASIVILLSVFVPWRNGLGCLVSLLGVNLLTLIFCRLCITDNLVVYAITLLFVSFFCLLSFFLRGKCKIEAGL